MLSLRVSGQRFDARNQTKVSDIAFNNIWLAIVEQQLEPGQNITEEFLATMFDISRTPLREAIQKLISLGLIVRHKNRTMSVAELSLEHVINLSNTRESLEGLIACNVMERLYRGEVSLDEVEATHQKMKKLLALGEPELQLDLGRRFHSEMESLCNNYVAIGVLDQIMLAMEPYRYLILKQEERFESIVQEHEEILTAIKGNNKIDLINALNTHFSNARANYGEQLQNVE